MSHPNANLKVSKGSFDGLKPTHGFTLLEMILVLFLLGLMASTGMMLTDNLEDQAKFEETKKRMVNIRKAILGDSYRTINGHQDLSGFVADMGRLPMEIRELVQRSYCYDEAYDNRNDCVNNGEIWHEMEPYALFYYCDDPLYDDETECLTNGGFWEPHPANLSMGWRGPYIDAFPDRLGELHIRDGYGNQGDDSNAETSDSRNSGWIYNLDVAGINASLVSLGYEFNNNGDDVLYPDMVTEEDWRIAITSGLTMGFVKEYSAYPMVSRCSDPLKSSKSVCLAPETWYGGCSKAGFMNKTSCEAESGTWSYCSDGISLDRPSCGAHDWFGEGFGCSDSTKTTKTDCTSPATWRSCSDNGAITDQTSCESANEIWLGETIYSKPLSAPFITYTNQHVCLRIFYRNQDEIHWTSSQGLTISENGTYQTLLFSGFGDESDADGDSNTTEAIDSIPIGINAVGVYLFDGSNCTDKFYPVDRIQPIPVSFLARKQIPEINW